MAEAEIGNDLLTQAKAAGLIVQVIGERLSVRGPRTQEALIRRLIEHKADVLAALALTPHQEAPATPEPSLPFSRNGWDEARALALQAAVNARLDAIMASLPPDYPHRQARLNVLANERGIVAGLMAKHDPMLWRWPRVLERLLKRWNEEDRMTSASTQQKTISEDR